MRLTLEAYAHESATEQLAEETKKCEQRAHKAVVSRAHAALRLAEVQERASRMEEEVAMTAQMTWEQMRWSILPHLLPLIWAVMRQLSCRRSRSRQARR